MKDKDINIDDLLKQHLPKPSFEARLAAQARTQERLRAELDELGAEIYGKREMAGLTGKEWPGQLEPLVLAAAFVLHGEGDVERIARLADGFAGEPVQTAAVRFTLHRLIRRALIAERDRLFTVTPEGERALSQARDAARRWIEALKFLE
jgi:hypothetical protein